MPKKNLVSLLLAVLLLATTGVGNLYAYQLFGSGWTSTASGNSSLGAPVKLTWSIVPDGTSLPTGLGEPSSPNNLVAFLDGVHHGGASPGGADLTQRSWFSLMESAFERWDAVSGIDYEYEPNDDGIAVSSAFAARGILGTRGDQRVGGHPIDGQGSPTFLAYNYFPNGADMVIDTDEINRWSNASSNFLLFRNTMMHEIGHGLGIHHVGSSNASFLMESLLATTFDGPQLDDILAAHRLYGDANEENGGNDNFLNATLLGSLSLGSSISRGVDAVSTAITPNQIDFLSIDDNSDTDFFRFTVSAAGLVDLTLTPLGPTYQEGAQGGTQSPLVTSELSNLALTLFDTDGTSVLQTAASQPIGVAEQISDFAIASPGDYFVRITGAQNAAQFYQLDVAMQAVPEPSTLLLLVSCAAMYGTAFRRRR